MQTIELHIITVCAVLLAVDPLGKLFAVLQNMHHRRQNALAKRIGVTK